MIVPAKAVPGSRLRSRSGVDPIFRLDGIPEAPAVGLNPLSALLCPDCGKALCADQSLREQPFPDFTVLQCCRAWPVVAGIPVFNGDPRLVDLISAGRHRQALLMAIRPSIVSEIRSYRLSRLVIAFRKSLWEKRAARVLDASPRYSDVLGLYFDRSRTWVRDYSYFKFTTPKHLAALSIASTFPDGPVLDLGCGAGHITRYLATRNPAVGLDSIFWLLYLAKTFVAPTASFVCCDADKPLPFASASFGSAMSNNAFHFLHDQQSAWNEILRVCSGPVALVSLRHQGIQNNVDNQALTIDGYRALAAGSRSSCCITGDQAIVDRYLQRLGPDLTRDGDALETEPLVTLIVTDDAESHGRFDRWPHIGSGINPLYRPEGSGYRLTWPSAEYPSDNPGFTYLKEYVDANPEDNFVLVDLPDRY